MANPIDFANYPDLFQYAILAQTGITSALTKTVTVVGGKYGNAGGDAQITGTFSPAGPPTQDSTNPLFASANAELGNALNSLISDILALPSPSSIASQSSTTLVITPGVYDANSSPITFDSNAVLDFNAGGNPDAQFFIRAPAGIDFNTMTMTLSEGAQACNIFWLAGTSITVAAVPEVFGVLISGTGLISFDDASPSLTGRAYAKGTEVTFKADTVVTATDCTPICYAKGTQILTRGGYVPIEDLKVGDKVATHGYIVKKNFKSTKQQFKTVLWTSKFTAPNTVNACPIRIQKDALGENTPFADLYVSPNHAMIVDGKSVCAKTLVNGTTIVQEYDQPTVEYYHLELSSHCGIVANGVISESYRDVPNARKMFENSTAPKMMGLMKALSL